MILLMYSNFMPDWKHQHRLSELSGQEVIVVGDEKEAVAAAPETTIWIGHRFLHQAWPHQKRLEWLQITSGGQDPLQFPVKLPGPWPAHITRCIEHSDVIAHHAIALAWHQWRRLDQTPPYHQGALAADSHFWPPLPGTAMVLGLGRIGTHLSRMLTGLGLRVWGVSRHKPTISLDSEKNAMIHAWFGPDHWRTQLPHADLLFVCLPRIPGAAPILGTDEICALPKHAILVSVSRSELIDRRALVQALCDRQLAGAALDMALPPDQHALWQAPGLYLSPKTAALHGAFQTRVQLFVEAQVERFVQGKPLMEAITPI